MSLEAPALSQPPSDLTSQPQGQAPVNGDAPAELTTPQPGVETIGGNGGPDWRAILAGDDSKAMETLSRFKDAKDVPKTLADQRAEITRLQQQKATRLPDNATPEQIGEYRKTLGLPEIAKDAKPADFMAAYKISAPEGYEVSEVESGMLADYAKLAYEQGHSPREVKAATDFFFQQQAASNQALNKIAVDFQKAEQNAWRDAVGSKEYEAQLSAAHAYFKDQFADQPEMAEQILQARMPNGGRLGDSRWFGEMLAKQAMGDGYTDRIMANTLESSGKSLAQQQAEIESMRFKDKEGYDAAMKPGGKYESILAARQARGEIDDQGNEVRRRSA